MRINLTSVFVDDQDKALRFYTDVLGFVKKNDVPLGEHRWLTVVSPEEPDGTELLLEPDGHPAAGPFKRALVGDGIPFTSFAVDDVAAEYERLRALGVRFTQEPAGDGAGHHRRARRHLRQPDPDRESGLIVAQAPPVLLCAPAIDAPEAQADVEAQQDIARELAERVSDDEDERHQPDPHRQPDQQRPRDPATSTLAVRLAVAPRRRSPPWVLYQTDERHAPRLHRRDSEHNITLQTRSGLGLRHSGRRRLP